MMNSWIPIDFGKLYHPPYCDCDFPSSEKLINANDLFQLTTCRCGEQDVEPNELAWQWQPDSESKINIKGQEVIFHNIFSTGTAIVKGSKDLEAGMIHYWEIRVITPLVGTDVMFGVGTGDFNIDDYKYVYTSALGLSSNSWGFSYHGRVQHDSENIVYGHRFSQGCIIGIYVDRVVGYIEFFLNRTSCGIAYKNIPTDPAVKIFPMVSSTNSRSVVRLMNAVSVKDTLQFRALQAVVKNPILNFHLKDMPGLKPALSKYWFLTPPVRTTRHISTYEDIIDEAVMCSKKKQRTTKKKNFIDEVINVNDLYSDAHKMICESESESNGSDDESQHFHYLF